MPIQDVLLSISATRPTVTKVSHWEVPRTAIGVRHLLAAARERGIEASDALAGTGLDAERPIDEVTGWQELAVARNLARALSDTTGLGVALGRRLHLVSYGAAGLAALACSTPRNALKLARYFPDRLAVLSRTELEEVGHRSALRFDAGRIPADVRRMLLERDVIAVTTALREVAGRPLTGLTIDLELGRDAAHDELVDALRITPSYDAPATRLLMDDAFLDAPAPQADPDALVEAMVDVAQHLDRRPPRSNVAGAVVAHLEQQPGPPRLEPVAAALHTTPRTLRRQLAAEGTSFRALADEVRRARADALLAEGRLSVEQIGVELGYADAAAFSHAFRRWTGLSPSQFRRSASAR
ncbi:transcriptional regulator, AraC family [Nocardioides sp. YR527]|nr:transcriptional regulator, AraC family [Nocardioides sp. YR527]